MNPIPVLFVTYNRLEYSKQALESICYSPGLPIELVIWDNGSTDGTVEWLKEEISWRQQRNAIGPHIHFSPKNVGLAPAMNWFFRRHAGAPYVVKCDNDTILPDNWLADLMDVMTSTMGKYNPIGAVSGTCLRPPGLKAVDWYAAMPKYPFGEHTLYFNPACLGTGVLINMAMIRERGLLFEKFPRAPGAGPDDRCLISGWGAYIQEASAYSDWRFAMYSKVPVKLLNLKEDQVLSNDYPEYDAEVKKVRDEGNAWWESVGGIDGVRKYVQNHGGLEQLPKKGLSLDAINTFMRQHYQPIFTLGSEQSCMPKPFRDLIRDPIMYGEEGLPPSVWTEASGLEARSTFEFWSTRVKQHGAHASTFLTTPQARINEFTAEHMSILQEHARDKDVLEVGCGWGRMSWPISRLAKSYIGTDFIPELVDKARESLPDLEFLVAHATSLPFQDGAFDLVVAIACLSSFAAILNKVEAELKRVLRPGGRILFLEEDFARIDWKLKNV
jgi:glycosyltransferase involved in cell wall biosynthesis